jgi:hypothetical protein
MLIEAAPRRHLCALAALVALCGGCRQLLGTDEFQVRASPDDEAVENPCASLEVPAGGECIRVGVGSCGDGFASDGRGGCDPVLPEGACEAGTYARPGLQTCSGLQNITCQPGDYGLVTEQVGQLVYVGTSTTEGPWFATLEEALERTSGDVTIALSRGTHTANAAVAGRRVQILGACPDVTALVGASSAPVIRFGLGADGSRVERVAVTGPGPGIVVSSAADIRLIGVWVHDLAGAGIVFDDADGWSADPATYRPATGFVERVLVQRATELGVASYGARLELRDVQIADTQPLRSSHRAHGLLVRPSPRIQPTSTLPVDRARWPGEVTVTRSLVEGSRGAGVIIEGSRVVLDSTVVRGVEPDLFGHGRGVDVRAHLPGRIAAELVVRQSLVERAHDVGISSWNGDSVLVEDTVIRDIGEGMQGRCLGNGVRARYDLVRDVGADLGVRVEVRRTLVERARQAAIHIEGGSAHIERALVRDPLAEPCRGDFGDGIAVHESVTGGATVTVERTRVEGAARAGVASFRSATTLDGVLVACSGADLIAEGGRVTPDEAICGCGEALARCQIQPGASSMIGGSRCDASDDTACFRGCSGTITQPGSVIENATIRVYGHDEIPSVLSDASGCYEIEGIPPGEPTAIAFAEDRHAPGLGLLAPMDGDSPAPYHSALIEVGLLPAATALFGEIDLRTVFLLATRICEAPKRDSDTVPETCQAVTGARGALAPGPVDPPIYWGITDFPDRSLDSAISSNFAFRSVPIGEHVVTLEAPTPGQSLRCEPDPGGLGWMTDRADQVRVIAEDGFPTMMTAEVNCEVLP